MAKKQFKAESKRLLDLMINSIYTNKEIFLREIISNASDAIDKLCYLSLTDDKVGLEREDYRIRITVDKDERTITVSDNGIGMTQDEAEKNLGVIAKSGSYKFKSEMDSDEAEKDDISIIGRNTSGVKLMNIDQESDIKVASIAKVRESVTKENNVFDEEFYDEDSAESEDMGTGNADTEDGETQEKE